MNFYEMFLVFVLFESAQVVQSAWDPKRLFLQYGECVTMLEKYETGTSRLEDLNMCIEVLEKIHGQIVPLETIAKVLNSSLTPLNNQDLLGSCVVESFEGRSNVSVIEVMKNFAGEVESLIDNKLKWAPRESLECFELDRARKFMCDAQRQCAQTKLERKQLEMIYIAGYSLFQLAGGTNQKLNCSTKATEEWTGQISDSVLSSKTLDMNTQLFEFEDKICLDESQGNSVSTYKI